MEGWMDRAVAEKEDWTLAFQACVWTVGGSVTQTALDVECPEAEVD